MNEIKEEMDANRIFDETFSRNKFVKIFGLNLKYYNFYYF